METVPNVIALQHGAFGKQLDSKSSVLVKGIGTLKKDTPKAYSAKTSKRKQAFTRHQIFLHLYLGPLSLQKCEK
jgi:hypothetical protein